MSTNFDSESWEIGYEAGIKGEKMPVDGYADRDSLERGYAEGEAIYIDSF